MAFDLDRLLDQAGAGWVISLAVRRSKPEGELVEMGGQMPLADRATVVPCRLRLAG